MTRKIILFSILTSFLVLPWAANARDQISIVGSSTVYPFASAVAEEFSKKTAFKNIVVESTGSGAGLKLFCAGVGQDTPDIANSSRKIKDSEIANCKQNGVTQITEVKIGYDGIVLGQSSKASPINLSLKQLYLALAKNIPQDGKMISNPYSTWYQIDPSLPNMPIEVMGPPPSSGTRDSFLELAMEGGCKTIPELAQLKNSDEKAFKVACQSLREDGKFIEAGENDNLIVQKLSSNLKLIGVFGYSYFEQNRDHIRAVTIDGIAPSFDTVQNKKYEIARDMYFYVKNAHLDLIPGLREYIAEFTSEKSMGDHGYLISKGLIPLPKTERAQIREQARNAKTLAM